MTHFMDTIIHLGEFLDLVLIKWRKSPWKYALLKVLWGAIVSLVMVSMPKDYAQIELGKELSFSEKQLDLAVHYFQGPNDYVALTTKGHSRGEYFSLLKSYRFTNPTIMRGLFSQMTLMDKSSSEFELSVIELKKVYAEYSENLLRIINIYDQRRMDLILENAQSQNVSNLEGKLQILSQSSRKLEQERELLKIEMNRANFLDLKN